MKLDILQENTLLERFFVKLFRPTLLFYISNELQPLFTFANIKHFPYKKQSANPIQN